MSISVNNLTKIFGEQKAIDSISFDIPQGQIVGFLGPNGAGKSTTMKILTCFLPQTEGEAHVCGYNTRTHALDVKRNIGYLPENNPLYKDMYVKEYLTYAAKLFQMPFPEKKAQELIDRTGLGIEQHKKINQLSKGYKQRVGIAQAMIPNPEVLILDEPTSGLDPNQLVEIRKLIIEIGKEKTVLLSTHIMQEVEAMCERVIIINRGKIVADDSALNLKQSKGKEIVVSVEFSEKISIADLKSLQGVTKVEEKGTEYKIYQKNGKNDIRQEIFSLAVTKGWTILNLHREERDLEDIFKELTGNK